MSGGSMDYLFSKIQDASFSENTPERRAFKTLLDKVAKALHDIEWVDSCDYGKGDEVAAIMACITPSDVLAEAIKQAERARAELNTAIDRAIGLCIHEWKRTADDQHNYCRKCGEIS